MASQTYDAIVIGSGITGGWAAKELSEKGLRTLVLEAGRPINPDTDYVEHVPVWEKRFRGMGDRWRETETQAVQQKCSALMSGAASFSSTTRRTLTSRIPISHFCGFAAGKSADAPSCGGASPIAGATWTSKRTSVRESRLIGRFATRTLRPGMTMSKTSSA